MHLLIDIGNTAAKFTVCDGTRFTCVQGVGKTPAEVLDGLLSAYAPTACAYTCVGEKGEEWEVALEALPIPVLHVTGNTPTPLRNRYATPETLGADRLAAAVGAAELFPCCDLLVVDAGTCITCDLVTRDGDFMGGNISPGVEMRLKALHEQTARLPKVEAEGDLPPWGRDTETAIRVGVLRGVAWELAGCVQQLKADRSELKIVMTGGSRLPLSDSLQAATHSDVHLVARGLNRLLLDYLTKN